MAQLTFPESMEKLDSHDMDKSLNVLENYIGYICERTDFAMRNMTKTVTSAGISTAEMYILIQAQAQTLATLQSSLNQLTGTVNGLVTTVGNVNSGLVKSVNDLTVAVGDANSGLVKAVGDLTTTVGNLTTTVGDNSGGLVKSVNDLDTSVGNLNTTVGDNSSGLVKAVNDINTAIGDTSTAGTIMYQLDDLDRRVTALEQQNI